jgi:hypothetical protein
MCEKLKEFFNTVPFDVNQAIVRLNLIMNPNNAQKVTTQLNCEHYCKSKNKWIKLGQRSHFHIHKENLMVGKLVIDRVPGNFTISNDILVRIIYTLPFS